MGDPQGPAEGTSGEFLIGAECHSVNVSGFFRTGYSLLGGRSWASGD